VAAAVVVVRSASRSGIWAIAIVLATAATARAQAVQVTPFGGYRFGGDLYEIVTGTALDIDGAASVGVIGDVFWDIGRSVTFIYSHQEAPIDLVVAGVPRRVRLSVDHWHGGATDELGGTERVRPFLTGSLGLTRFGGSGDAEVRFSMAVSGGVAFMGSPRFGARVDGRVYAVFVDANAGTTICSPGICALGLDVSVVWQAEFTAGLVMRF
jgi:hypothetical protein